MGQPLHSTATLAGAVLLAVAVVFAIRSVAWLALGVSLGQVPRLLAALGTSPIWLRGHGLRARWAERSPGTFGVVAARFDRTRFSGLPLTLMVVAALYILAALAGLIDDVREAEGVVRLDQGVDAAFGPYRAPWLLKTFLWITALGAGPCLAAMAGVATALLWSGRHVRLIPPLWITFAGAQATTWTSKYVIDRPRPVFLPDITEWNPSFPSGHATATTALIGILGYIVARDLVGRRERFEVGFLTVTIVSTICFSRLFLGVHFLSDVLAGLLVGSFWLLVGVTVAELGRVRKIPVAASPGPATLARD